MIETLVILLGIWLAITDWRAAWHRWSERLAPLHDRQSVEQFDKWRDALR